MQKRTMRILSIVGVLVLAASCSFEMPSEVALQGSPAFEIPAGNRVTTLSDALDLETALDDAADSVEGLSRSDTADGDPLALELNRSLINVSVSDFSTDNLALDGVSQTIDVNYTVPEIGFADESFSTNIDPIEVPASVTIPGVSLSSPAELAGSATLTTPNPIDASSGFDSVTFDDGTLEGATSVTDDDDSLTTLDITGARILTTDGSEIVAADNVSINALAGGTLNFPLAGVQLPSSFDVEITVSIASDIPTSGFSLDLAFDFSTDTRISGAEGIDFSQSLTGTYTIPIGSDLDFQSVTVGTGSLYIDNTFPTDWNGIAIEANPVELTQNTTSVAGPAPATEDTRLNLAGSVLTKNDITVSYTVGVTGTNASFSLDPDADEVTSTTQGGITNFSEVVIAESTFDTVNSFSTPIDQETQDLVEWVLFTNPVIDIALDNQLGVDVEVGITSTTQSNGNPVTITPAAGSSFASGSGEVTNSWDLAPNSAGNEFYIDMDSIDLDVAITFPDGTPNDGFVTLTNLSPGDPLSLAGSVDAKFDVQELTIASASLSGQFPEAGDAGIDFSQIGDSLPDDLLFDGITSELLFDAAGVEEIQLYLEAQWTNADGTTDTRVFVENADTPGAPATFSSGNTVDIGDEIQDVINGRPSDLFFHYDVIVAGATIDVGTTTAGDSIGAAIEANIPFVFTAGTDIELLDENDEPLVPPFDEDVFGRTAGETSEIDDLIDSIQSMTLNLSIANNIGIQGQIVIDEDDGAFRKEIDLVDDPEPIELTLEDLEVVKEFPFDPTIQVFLLSGTQEILTNGDVEIGMWLQTQTDLDFSFSLTGEDE